MVAVISAGWVVYSIISSWMLPILCNTVAYRRLKTDVFQAMKTADDPVKRTDAKYQEAKELGYRFA